MWEAAVVLIFRYMEDALKIWCCDVLVILAPDTKSADLLTSLTYFVSSVTLQLHNCSSTGILQKVPLTGFFTFDRWRHHYAGEIRVALFFNLHPTLSPSFFTRVPVRATGNSLFEDAKFPRHRKNSRKFPFGKILHSALPSAQISDIYWKQLQQ